MTPEEIKLKAQEDCGRELEAFLQFCIDGFGEKARYKELVSDDGKTISPPIVAGALSIAYVRTLEKYGDMLHAASHATGTASVLSDIARRLIEMGMKEDMTHAEAANDALRQWQHAEQTNDTTELDNARKSRDASISGEKHRPKL